MLTQIYVMILLQVSPSEGGSSGPPTELSIYSRLYQSGRYSEQSMGISSCLAHVQATLILGGRYHVNWMSPQGLNLPGLWGVEKCVDYGEWKNVWTMGSRKIHRENLAPIDCHHMK